MPSGSCRSSWIPTPGCVTAPIRKAVETAREQRESTGIRFQSKPAKTPKMIARASTLLLPSARIHDFATPRVSLKAIEGDGWRAAIPDDLIPADHQALGYDSGTIAR